MQHANARVTRFFDLRGLVLLCGWHGRGGAKPFKLPGATRPGTRYDIGTALGLDQWLFVETNPVIEVVKTY